MNNKHSLYIIKQLIILLLAFVVSSCLDETEIDPEKKPEGEVYFTMTVQVPSVKAPKTYASSISETQENRIEYLDIFAFTEGDNEEQIFSYRLQVAENQMQSSDNGAKKTFTLQVKRMQESVKLMVVANSRSIIDKLEENGFLEEGEITKTELINLLTFNGNTWENLSAFDSKGFPMWGHSDKALVTNQEKINDIEPVKLMRAVAKIEIGADIYGDPAIGFGKMFKIENVYVFRSYKIGAIAPHTKDLGEEIARQINIPTGAEKYGNNEFFKYKYDAVTDTESNVTAMFRQIYIPETEACVRGSEKEATCLVIEADYNNKGTSFYRVDFKNKDGDYMPLLRNHRYLINITSIKGEGYKTAQEAANATNADLESNIQITAENINDIDYNNQYWLGVSKANHIITNQVNSSLSLFVHTTYEEGWVVESHPDWLNVDPLSSAIVGEDINVVVSVQNLNMDQQTRIGTITLRAGTISKVITIQQPLGANSYIVHTGMSEGIQIPVAYANSDGVNRVTNGTYNAKVLWKDNQSLNFIGLPETVSGKESLILIRPSGTATGNAIIGLQNSQGKTVWSWHIWVTDGFDPNSLNNQKTNNGYTFMDRNLGAMDNNGLESYGLLYQWGRKDPFPGALNSNNSINGSYNSKAIYNGDGLANINYVELTEDNNVENSIQNPMTFYYNGRSPYNWAGLNNHNNNLWSDAQGNKSIYDPCPVGWRVPVSGSGTLSPWYGMGDGGSWGNGGRNWPVAGFYPATGGRMYDSGAFTDVTIRGSVWSATANGFNAYVFRFGENSSSILTSGSSPRANAYPVRCVKDE